MTTTQVDTQVYAASDGGTSTPVKLQLQPFTIRYAIELLVATVRATGNVSPLETGKRRGFRLYWATSYQNIGTLADAPNILKNSVGVRNLNLDDNPHSESIIVEDKPKGQYLYVWFDHPHSPDAYTMTATVTELFFNAGVGGTPISVSTSGTLVTGSVTVVTTAGTTQTLPAAPQVGAFSTVKNQTAGDTTVAAGAAGNIFYQTSVATYNLIPGEAETFQWDGTFWNVI